MLAYLGGPHVFGKDRRLRVEGERPALGFHRFEVSGRNARALEAADPPELGDLAKARGHLVAGWLVHGSGLDRLSLLPEEEPPPFATARARRWHSGDYVFESLDFDTEVEEEARLRLEQNGSLGDLKGVPATLRQAYASRWRSRPRNGSICRCRFARSLLTRRRSPTKARPQPANSPCASIASAGRPRNEPASARSCTAHPLPPREAAVSAAGHAAAQRPRPRTLRSAPKPRSTARTRECSHRAASPSSRSK